jgi:hypothetical protein
LASLLYFVCCSLVQISAQENPYANVPGAPTPKDNSVLTNSPIRQVSASVFAIGDILLDREKTSVSFPAYVNMDVGPVEYFCVHNTGKTHESVIATKVSPFQIHLAMLLVSEPGQIPSPAGVRGMQIQEGPPVSVDLSWEDEGQTKIVPAEDLVLKVTTQKPLERGMFRYTSSQQINNSFLAHIEGNVISIMTDPNCLINIGDPDRANDDIWIVNTNTTPKVGTPLTVILKLSGAEKVVEKSRKEK